MGDEGPTEDSFATGGAKNDDEWVAVPGDASDTDQWSAAGRGSIDEMARTLSTFGTRLDALVTSTTSYRAAITDRLVEYADMVSRLVKNQSADLAEHRSSNQHFLAELQSGIASSESAVSSLTNRVDELLGVGSGDESQEILSEIRSVLDAQERLGQFLTDALDQFGDRVVERLDLIGTEDGSDDLSGALISAQESDKAIEESLKTLNAEVRSLRDNLVDLASGDVVGALWDEVRALRSLVDGLGRERRPSNDSPLRAFAAVDDVRREIAALRQDLTSGLVVEADDSLSDHLEEIRERLGTIESAAGAPLDRGEADDRIVEVADSVAEMRAALTQALDAQRTTERPDRLDTDELLLGHLDEIRERLATIESVAGAPADRGEADDRIAEVADSVAEIRAALVQGVDARPTPELSDRLEAIQSDLTDVVGRLDGGLEIDIVTDDDVADRVAGLRDEVTAELEAVRRILADKVDPPPAPSETDDVVEEVRAAVGSALEDLPDAVAEALNAELVALRRRIKVRSEADVLTDEQLDRIAQAVADRLS